MRQGLGTANRRLKLVTGRVRYRLRVVMPRLAMAAGLAFSLWLLVRNNSLLHGAPLIRSAFGAATFILVCLTLAYYGLKALRWLKRRLLWRVRRRLVITYLFVGLTPIVLLLMLGLLSAFGGSGQAMARIITAQLNTTGRQTQIGARTLAEGFSRLPPGVADAGVQSWLDERTALIQSLLPGARVALWRAAAEGEEARSVGHNRPANFVSESRDEMMPPIGRDETPTGAPLPEWLRGREEWSGVAFTPAADESEPFVSASVRALARGQSGGRPFAVLLIVPISRAFIEQYRAATGIYLRPFFMNPEPGRRASQAAVRAAHSNGRSETQITTSDEEGFERRTEELVRKDQLGEQLDGTKYPVILSTTNWSNGESRENIGFLFDWSWAVVGQQFWGGSLTGETWRKALTWTGVVFLVLELLALLAAAWMTRAVTGTVHKLYRATEFIKRGDFSHRVRVRSRDQLGELAVSFNDMAANIESLLHERVERERLEREVEIAAEVQAQLFPRSTPDLQTVHISADCRAARGVAGDYYDYIEIAPGLVALALGDVSGKGVSAALVMSNLQAALRAQTTITAERLSTAERAVAVSAATSSGAGQLLAHVVADARLDGAVSRMTANINGQLCRSTDANRFATLFLAIYEERTRTLRYTNAGHNAPLLVRSDGTVERLVRGGVMVGAFDWATYEESSVKLRKDDLLLIFSDGITEAESADGLEYGEERLTEFAVKHRRISAVELQRAVFDEIDRWSGTRERNDDQTLVIVKNNQ